jgi:SAM-dependent methyltransferase
MHSHEILERDDGHIAVIGHTTTYFENYGAWPPHERKAIGYARGRVLDIGCGAGRFMLYLERKGFEVTGIDNSPLSISVCRKRGLKDARVLSVTQVSSRLGTFDTILLFGGTFGLLSNVRRARWLLRRFHNLTSRTGRIIAQSCDPHQMASPERRRFHRANVRRGRLPGQLRMRIRYKTYATPWWEWLVVSKGEMAKLLAGTGWKVRRFIDSKTSSYIVVIDKESVRGRPIRRK